ncbi:MAG TPA: hypothetical protein VKQ32_12285 [Polyangia bacterium]|nr:hypothetical protein [Polyangia bacterium]
MGRKKTRGRGRLSGIAAGLAATAAALIPGVATASAAPATEATEAAARTTPPERLLELANSHPDQVLANRGLRRLRTRDPDAHREILLAARFARAELPLARLISRTDRPTLRLFACDCALRVAPLYERLGCDSRLLARARAAAAAALETRAAEEPAAAASPAGALEIALARVERDVAAFEQEVEREATLGGGALGTLGRAVLTQDERPAPPRAEESADEAPVPPRRLVAVAMAAARAIDDALLVAAGGSVSRIDSMREAIAEAIYLDHVFRTGEPAGAIDAVFRELAWERAHLHALRARSG